MNRLIHIGFGNIVNTDKIIAIVSPEAAPIKRLVQKAKETGQAIDATQDESGTGHGEQSGRSVGTASRDNRGKSTGAVAGRGKRGQRRCRIREY
jgi:hypothetical protein